MRIRKRTRNKTTKARRFRPAAVGSVHEQPLEREGNLRPAARYLLIVGSVLVLLRWPWVALSSLVLPLLMLALLRLCLGGERLCSLAVSVYGRLAERRPGLAEVLRHAADSVALFLDGILDRLPEKWTQGLYLPDFGTPPEPDIQPETRPDPFDRLAAEARRG